VLSVDDVIGCDVTLLTSLAVDDDVTCGDVTVVCVLNAAVVTVTHVHHNARNTTTKEKLKKNKEIKDYTRG